MLARAASSIDPGPAAQVMQPRGVGPRRLRGGPPGRYGGGQHGLPTDRVEVAERRQGCRIGEA